MSEEYFLIVNLLAGRGRCRYLWPQLEHLLRKTGLNFRFALTEAPGAGTELAARASRDYPVVVAVGGDGTIHEVAAGVMGSQAKLGIIPAGTGNDFVKMLGIPPDDLVQAAQILKESRSKKVDVGRLGERFFVNGLGLGLDGAVAWRVFRLWRWPIVRHWIYLYAAIHEALCFRSVRLEIKGPDWKYSGALMMLGASNGRYHGGDFKLAPNAEIDDGLFDVYLIADMSPLRRLLKIPIVRRGEHLELPEVQMQRASWIEIVSEKPLLGHLDGEPIELPAGGFRVGLLPKALEVIVG